MQTILLDRLNEEQNKLNYYGSLLISILSTKKHSAQDLIDLFEEITDSLSNAYVAVLNCTTKSLLKECVHITNQVSFMVAGFGGAVQELEAIC